jgi:hypothetical protein
MKIIKKVTLDQVDTIARNIPDTKVCWAVKTCWWCFHHDIPYRTDSGLPSDPRGSVLMQGKLGIFIQTAKDSVEHYGKHGLDAFIAAYHGNLLTDEGKPTSFETWDQYNELLNKQEEEKKDG